MILHFLSISYFSPHVKNYFTSGVIFFSEDIWVFASGEMQVTGFVRGGQQEVLDWYYTGIVGILRIETVPPMQCYWDTGGTLGCDAWLFIG